MKITIPPAALEAGAWVICLRDGFNPYDEVYTLVPASHPMQKLVRRWTLYVDATRAAFEAMVANWEGAEHQTTNEWSNKEHLILPLTETSTKENDNG